MSELRKAKTENPYFITLTVVGWIDIFTRSVYSEIILDSFEFCRINKNMENFCYVIMPSHIHFIGRNLDEKMQDVLRDLKAHTARQIIKLIESENYESRKDWLLHMFRYFAKFRRQNEKYQFWQKTSHPTELTSNAMFDQKRDYIHNNPVVAGYVCKPEDWNYSSANSESRFKVDEC